jgi:hypothetical protein
MERAFGVQVWRNPWPPLPHQPSPYLGLIRTGTKIGLGALLLLFAATFIFGGGSRILAQGSVPLVLDSKPNSVTLGPINVDRRYQIVAIRASAPYLDQAWVDLEYALVDRATQVSYQAYDVAERYSGRDSDGDWTEGSRSATVKLAAIPAGSYDLVVDYTGNAWGSGQAYGYQDLQIVVRRTSIFVSNVILAALLILLPLLYFWIRHLKFEHARQSESDVGPTGAAALLNSDEEDDEEEEDDGNPWT